MLKLVNCTNPTLSRHISMSRAKAVVHLVACVSVMVRFMASILVRASCVQDMLCWSSVGVGEDDALVSDEKIESRLSLVSLYSSLSSALLIFPSTALLCIILYWLLPCAFGCLRVIRAIHLPLAASFSTVLCQLSVITRQGCICCLCFWCEYALFKPCTISLEYVSYVALACASLFNWTYYCCIVADSTCLLFSVLIRFDVQYMSLNIYSLHFVCFLL